MKSSIFLLLFGIAAGALRLCCYKALQQGEASKVVPIDMQNKVYSSNICTCRADRCIAAPHFDDNFHQDILIIDPPINSRRLMRRTSRKFKN